MADNNSLSPTYLIQAGEILEHQGKKGLVGSELDLEKARKKTVKR